MKELENLKEELNGSIFKDIHYTDVHMREVLSSLHKTRKRNKQRIMKPVLVGLASAVCFMVLFQMAFMKNSPFTGSHSDNHVIAEEPTYYLEVNEKLLTDAKQRKFSPVPSIVIGYSMDSVKRILGTPDQEYSAENHPGMGDYSTLIYDNLKLSFRNGKLWSINISELNLNISELSSVLGKPVYQHKEENSAEVELYTYVVLAHGNEGFYFHCKPSRDDKTTIESVSFTNEPVFYE